MKKIFIVMVVFLALLRGGAVQALDIDYWYIVEVHAQNGEIIAETVVMNQVYKSYEEALSNCPASYTRKEVVFVPPKHVSRYWLREKRNNGGSWINTGRSIGPFGTTSEARNANPGTRVVTNTSYYIRELYHNFRNDRITATGKQEGPFSSSTAAKNRADALGVREAY